MGLAQRDSWLASHEWSQNRHAAWGGRDSGTPHDLTGAGYGSQQEPYDAFWGARYAVVEDPDGNPVGIMSPIYPDRKSDPDFP